MSCCKDDGRAFHTPLTLIDLEIHLQDMFFYSNLKVYIAIILNVNQYQC